MDLDNTSKGKLTTPLDLDASPSLQTPFFDKLYEPESQPGSPNPFIPPSSTEESDNLPSSSSSPASISPQTFAPQTIKKRKVVQEPHQTEPTPQNLSTTVSKSSNKMDFDPFEEKLKLPLLGFDKSPWTSYFQDFSDSNEVNLSNPRLSPVQSNSPNSLQSQPGSSNSPTLFNPIEASDNLSSSSSSHASISPHTLAPHTRSSRLSDAEYLPSSCQETSMSKQQLPKLLQKFSASQKDFPSKQQRKNRRIDTKNLPANAHFAIICAYCPADHRQKLISYNRNGIIDNFRRHMGRKHCEISADNIEKYMKYNLQEPEQLLRFLINCPEPSCKQITCKDRKTMIIQSLIRHLIRKHPNRKRYSEESIKNHVNKNYTTKIDPNPNKR